MAVCPLTVPDESTQNTTAADLFFVIAATTPAEIFGRLYMGNIRMRCCSDYVEIPSPESIPLVASYSIYTDPGVFAGSLKIQCRNTPVGICAEQ